MQFVAVEFSLFKTEWKFILKFIHMDSYMYSFHILKLYGQLQQWLLQAGIIKVE